MRGTLWSVVLAGAFAIAALTGTASAATAVPKMSATTASVYALQVPDKQIDDVTANERGGVRWYRNPIWIALAAFGGLIILLLIILAVRGGGAPIIKE